MSARSVSPDPAPGATAREGLGHDLGWALGVVLRSYARTVDAVVDDLPGGTRGYQVLAAATREHPANQRELARELGIDRTVFTYLVDDLERLGLVDRRPDPVDRRGRRIVATDRGREVLAQRAEALRHCERHLLGALGEDAPAFRELLCRLAAGADDLDPVRDTCAVLERLRAGEGKLPAAARPNRRAKS